MAPVFNRSASGDLITIAEAARMAGVHRNTVRSWCANGRLSSVRINRRGDRRVHRRDVERFVARRGSIAPGSTVHHAAPSTGQATPNSTPLAAHDAESGAGPDPIGGRGEALRRIAG